MPPNTVTVQNRAEVCCQHDYSWYRALANVGDNIFFLIYTFTGLLTGAGPHFWRERVWSCLETVPQYPHITYLLTQYPNQQTISRAFRDCCSQSF